MNAELSPAVGVFAGTAANVVKQEASYTCRVERLDGHTARLCYLLSEQVTNMGPVDEDGILCKAASLRK